MTTTDLGPRPDDPALLAAWYRSALALQARSRLNMTQFGERIGVSAATLYLWRRRQEAESRESARPASRVAPNESGLLELHIAGDHKSAQEPITVRMASGIAVEIPASFDVECLRQVLEVLRAC